MNHPSTTATKLALLVLLGAGVGTAPHLVPPGGGQFWRAPNGVDVYEGWGTIPVGGIPWRVHIVDDLVAPGFPILSAFPTVPFVQQPGVQSLVAASEAWSNATIPGGTGSVSPFQFDSVPSPYPLQATDGTGVMVEDADNTVSLWLDPAFWTAGGMGGGGTVLGIAAVYLIAGGAATGEVVGFDIAINTTQLDGTLTRPLVSHLEDNVATGLSVATAGLVDPEDSYADLQGIMVHEFGHAAGMGHSLIDSQHFTISGLSLMRTPTMFPFAQTEFAADRTITQISASAPGLPPAIQTGDTDFSATDSQGLMGSSARTLKADDLAALGVAYGTPGGAFQTQLCTISGRVIDQISAAVDGAHVTAVRRADPDVTRVSRLSDSLGNFEIQGLPPGDYYVFIEGPDVTQQWSPSPNGWKFGYFGSVIGGVANPSLPQFVEQGFAPPFDGAPIQNMERRFWSSTANTLASEGELISVGIGPGQTQVRALGDWSVFPQVGGPGSGDTLRAHPLVGPFGGGRNWNTGTGRGMVVPVGSRVRFEHRPRSFGPFDDIQVSCWVSRGRAFTGLPGPTQGPQLSALFQLFVDPNPLVFDSVPEVIPATAIFDYTPTASDANQMLFFQTVETRTNTQTSVTTYAPSGNVIVLQVTNP